MSKENTKTATTYTFRNKFEKLLTENNREPIVAAFNIFCSYNPDTALFYLWRLTYDVANIPEILDQLGLNMGIISPENVSTFRNELRVQYSNSQPDFLDTKILGEVAKSAFSTLYNVTDSIVANVVYKHCLAHVKREEVDDILHTIELLESDDAKSYWDGIYRLHFNAKQISYLKPYKRHIHSLLKAIHEYEQEVYAPSKPFANLGKLIEDSGFTVAEISEKPAKEEAATEESDFDAKAEIKEVLAEIQNDGKEAVEQESDAIFWPITPWAIISNEAVFTAFIEKGDRDTLSQIKKLGHDLNELMAKEELIKNFLEAAKALRK